MFRSRSVRWQIAILTLIPLVLGLIVGAITLPGSTTHAGPGSGINLNRSASIAEFIIPGVAVTTLAAKFGTGAAPIKMSLATSVASTFSVTSGEMLVGKTELVVWDLSGACGALGPNDVCVTARAKVGTAKQSPIGTRVQIATQLTSPINDTTDAVQCDLKAAISATAQPPIPLQCDTGQAAAFGATGFLTVAHSGTVLGLSSEYMEYDNGGGCTLAADQLCITARAQQPGNNKRAHLAEGFSQPCVTNNALTCTAGITSGTSRVTKHFQLNVKSNAGFSPVGPLVVYSVDGSNNIVGAELMDHNNAVDKIKTPTANEFHIVDRGSETATLQRTAVSAHAANSVVTGAHTQLVCRIGWIQPGVDTDVFSPGAQEPTGQVAGTSVAAYPVCYTRSQPDSPPKAGGKLDVPVIGSTFIVLSAVGIPWLSTGGLTGTVFGDIPQVDPNGTDDGSLVLTSPCIENFTPGQNLKVDLTLDTSDNSFLTPDVGTIRVISDTIPEGPGTTHQLCDDPAGVGNITQTTYIYPGDPTPGDDDTDGDGCTDIQELNPNTRLGGRRDPWNPQDFYDVNGDRSITWSGDILPVILAYLQGPLDPGGPGPQYTAAKDRGGAFGPFVHNRAEPDGTIEIPNDILPVILQFGHSCGPPSVPPPSGANCQDIPAVGLCLRAKNGSGETGVTSCDDPQKPSKCTVTLNEPFDLVLATNGIPPGGYVGFQSEIFFDGLEWLKRPACADEVVWPDDATRLCSQGPGGQAHHFAATALLPPLPLSTFTGDLLELDVVCTQAGSYDVGLTAVPTSPFGGVYADATGSEILVAADALRINCIDTPTPLESFTETIGTAGTGGTPMSTGDTAITGDVEVALAVPPGALTGDTPITIDVFNASDVPRPPGSGPLLSRAFNYGPDTTFALPVTLTYTYTTAELALAGVDEQFLDVAQFNSLTGQWELAEVISRDLVNHSLTVAVSHFSESGRLSHDFDGDGCVNSVETQTDQDSEVSGGLRDWTNKWDFFDVNGDHTIDVPNDLLPVILAYQQGPNDPGGPGPLYSEAKDRGPAIAGAQFAWQRTAPDGSIDVPNDLLPIILQYFHDCRIP